MIDDATFKSPAGPVNGSDAGIVTRLLAAGLLAEHRRMRETSDVYLGSDCAPELREAMVRLSRLSLATGAKRDLGGDYVLLSHLATRPMAEWGLPTVDADHELAGLVLVDPDLHAPTRDAMLLAAEYDGAVDAEEDAYHALFRSAVGAARHRPTEEALYTAGRTFVVRHPVAARPEVTRFAIERPALSRVVGEFYRPVPAGAYLKDVCHVCSGCGSVLWPWPDRTAYPYGRCRVRECREENGACPPRASFERSEEPMLLQDAVLLYWVGPGLGEVAIHDALAARGLDVSLYPGCDAADIGLDGDAVGIDVKSYASPDSLGRHFKAKGIGGLARFVRRIVSVPDAKIQNTPDYVSRLTKHLEPAWGIEVMSVSETIAELLP